MMYRTFTKNVPVEIPADPAAEQLQDQQQHVRTLKVIQTADTDKENLVRSVHPMSLKPVEHESKKRKMSHKFVQTSEDSYAPVTSSDLTSEEAGENYWRLLAEKRSEALDESFKENEKLRAEMDELREDVEELHEQYKSCQGLLKEARNLVFLLKGMVAQESEPKEEPAAEKPATVDEDDSDD